jgi:hypothetical protein
MDKKEMSKTLRKEFFERFATLVTGAFTFVAGLAWNDAVQAIISRYIPSGKTIVSQVVYAVIITFVAIISIMQVNSVAKRIEGVDQKN